MRDDETVRIISLRRAHKDERMLFQGLTGYAKKASAKEISCCVTSSNRDLSGFFATSNVFPLPGLAGLEQRVKDTHVANGIIQPIGQGDCSAHCL